MAEKLIRHRIPQLAGERGERLNWRYAAPEEMLELLKAKLMEEVAEFVANPSLEELADVCEVVDALCTRFGKYEVSEVQTEKAFDKGRFDYGIVLLLAD